MKTAEAIGTIVAPPQVGDGATICSYSDRYAGTVISVSASGKKMVVQRDKAIRTDNNGMSDSQQYEYSRDPQGARYEFSLRSNGYWIEVGAPMRQGLLCWVGARRAYYDFSF